jgi:hypothetical protein
VTMSNNNRVGMTSRAFRNRMAALLIVLAIVAGTHLGLRLNSTDIARSFATTYVPLSKQEAVERVQKYCKEISEWSHQRQYCNKSIEDRTAIEQRDHAATYESDVVGRMRDRFDDSVDIVAGFSYAAIALAAAWALLRWFGWNVWPTVARALGRVRVNLGMSDRRAAWQLQRAEKDFRTLKSLRDDDIITEEVFTQRRDRLKAGLKVRE